MQFYVIIIDPLWAEYTKRLLQVNMQFKEHQQSLSLEELKQLQIDKIAYVPVSSSYDDRRELFKTWGFKRCENIVWLGTNKDHSKQNQYVAGQDQGDNLFKRVKEHCLVGLREIVKRASDQHFINAYDVIITEEEAMDLLKSLKNSMKSLRGCVWGESESSFLEKFITSETIGSLLRNIRQIPQQYNNNNNKHTFIEQFIDDYLILISKTYQNFFSKYFEKLQLNVDQKRKSCLLLKIRVGIKPFEICINNLEKVRFLHQIVYNLLNIRNYIWVKQYQISQRKTKCMNHHFYLYLSNSICHQQQYWK